MRIWKWQLKVEDAQTVAMPAGAKLLSVEMQAGQLCVWALVNPEAPPTPRGIRIAGTGHPLPAEPGEFVGTVMLNSGMLVFHVFDMGEV